MKALHAIPTVYLALAGLILSPLAMAQTTDPAPQPAGVSPRAQTAAPKRVVEIVKLRHADSGSIANLLREANIPGATVAVDPITNSILVSTATDEILTQIRSLVTELDQSTEAAGNKPETPITVATVQLRLSDPQNLSRMLGALQPTKGELRIWADPASRSIWLGGEKSAVQEFTALAEQIESQASADKKEVRETRFYRVKNADTRGLANTLNEYVRTMPLDVRIVPDPASNTLLAYATNAQHEQLTRMISELDVVPTHRPAEKQPEPPAKPAATRDGVETHG